MQAPEELRTLSEGLADEDPQVREDCAQRLAALEHPEAAPFLRHALDDDAPEVRMWGAYGLAVLERPEDADALRRAMREDDSPLVRLWATFGVALQGEDAAAKSLVEQLDLPDLELRVNAADALISLQDPSIVRPLLERRLAGPDERRRAWAAAVLHRYGHRDAFGIWREALVGPKARVHAAMVAPHLGTLKAARELVRVCAELSMEALDAAVPEANELPLAELLTAPLLDLGLPALLSEAEGDAVLRADLLLIVLRGTSAEPEVVGGLVAWFSERDPEALARDVAQLLEEQAQEEYPKLLARLADVAADAVVPALFALKPAARAALVETLRQLASSELAEDTGVHGSLWDVLRDSQLAGALGELPPPLFAPDAFEDDEEDLGPVIERLAADGEVSPDERAKALAFLAELEMTPHEYLAGPAEAEPPTGEAVARRVMCLCTVVARAQDEAALAQGKKKPAEVKATQQALLGWAEEEGLTLEMTSMELDLLHAEPGEWLEEDVTEGLRQAEAVSALAWSVGQGKLPPAEAPVTPKAALAGLPLQGPVAGWAQGAQEPDVDMVAQAREVYECLLWRAEQEDAARRLLAGEEVEAALDVDALLEDLEQDGFDAKAAGAKGRVHLQAAALRFLGARAAQRLAEAGAVTCVQGDFPWRGMPVTKLDDTALREVLSVAEARQAALAWVAQGGEWDGPPAEDVLDEEHFDDEALEEAEDEDAAG